MGRRSVKLPPGCKRYVDRTGVPRTYYRHTSPPTALPGLPYSREFMEAYESAVARGDRAGPVMIGASRTLAGTVNAALVKYYLSDELRGDGQGQCAATEPRLSGKVARHRAAIRNCAAGSTNMFRVSSANWRRRTCRATICGHCVTLRDGPSVSGCSISIRPSTSRKPRSSRPAAFALGPRPSSTPCGETSYRHARRISPLQIMVVHLVPTL